MTPKMKGLGKMLAQLKHDVETAAGPLVSDLQTLGPDTIEAIKKAQAHVADAKAFKKDIEDFNASMEGSNGGPPLQGDSSGSSDSSAGEPQASWQGKQS